MTVDVLLIGSGKMALDIGSYLLGRGRTVAWVSSTRERLEVIERCAAKTLRRLARSATETAQRASFSAHVLGDATIPAAGCVIETTAESLAKKQRFLGSVAQRCGDVLLLSNSSSLLPSRIHPRCAGLHFFYPVALTGVVELVLPEGFGARSRAERFAADNGLQVIVEDERSAFAANRVLVPLQVECMRALRDGVPPEAVDECSAVGEMATGQLELMASVGLGIIRTSVENYAAIPSPIRADDTAVLSEILSALVERDGHDGSTKHALLRGAPLPWPSVAIGASDKDALNSRFAAVYANTLLLFEERGVLGRAELGAITGQVHGAASSVDALIELLGVESIRNTLSTLYRNDARSYFQPSRLLS